MTSFLQAMLALLLALGGYALAAGLATEVALRPEVGGKPRRGWMALAVASLLLALQQGFALELALSVGLYDLRAAVQAACAAICLALAVFAFRPLPA